MCFLTKNANNDTLLSTALKKETSEPKLSGRGINHMSSVVSVFRRLSAIFNRMRFGGITSTSQNCRKFFPGFFHCELPPEEKFHFFPRRVGELKGETITSKIFY